MKIFSGRYFLTLVAGSLLFYGTYSGKFEGKEVLSIIKDIVIFYFIVKHSNVKEQK